VFDQLLDGEGGGDGLSAVAFEQVGGETGGGVDFMCCTIDLSAAMQS
jgi:hypothetical protein